MITIMWMASLTLQTKIHVQTSTLILWCSMKEALTDELQVNVMQKSGMYWLWPNVDIYYKRADALIGGTDRVNSSMFAFLVSANAAKLFLSCSHCLTNLVV